MVKINGVEFSPHPEIGFKSDPVRKPVEYKYNYLRITELIASEDWPEIDTFRALIKNDLWFLLYFIVKPFVDDSGRAKANHPFTVKACQEVEEGPQDYTLDIWARFHFKFRLLPLPKRFSTSLKIPIMRPESFLISHPSLRISSFRLNQFLRMKESYQYASRMLYGKSLRREAPLWSLDEGIILKRDTNRKEASISGHGLVEGMPTGLHFERRVYDDISTNDMAQSPDIVEKVKHAFDTSQNLKTLVGSHHRVTGTYYSHIDPLIHVRDKKDLEGKPKYLLRFKPATEDGTATGKPVLMTQEALDELKGDSSFNCQQLLDPTPSSEQRLNPDFLQRIEPSEIPKNVHKFMLIDQAGDADSNKGRSTDAWAMGIFGVEPFTDEIGQVKDFH